MIENPEQLKQAAKEHTNGALRSIIEYEKRDYTIHHFRPDVQAAYTDDEVTGVIDELVMGSLGAEHFESIFNAGEFECSIFGFENAVMFHFFGGDTNGTFITVDRDVHLNLDDFINTCTNELTIAH